MDFKWNYTEPTPERLQQAKELADKIGMSPLEGLDKPRILENFIPVDMIGKQKKLIQQKGDDDE